MSVGQLYQIAADAIERGDAPAAKDACTRLIALGANGPAHYLLGLLHIGQEDWNQALIDLEQAHAAMPDYPEAAFQHGLALHELGHSENAIAAWRDTLRLAPDHRGAWLHLSILSQSTNPPGITADLYERALHHHPDDLLLLYHCGLFHLAQNHLVEAQRDFTKAVAIAPDCAAAWINLGMTYEWVGCLDQAETAYRQAIATAEADDLALAHFNLGNILLRQGQWSEGFAEFEWRRQLPDAPAPNWTLPEWQGAEPTGTRILLWNDQGMGDAIQFLRLVPTLTKLGYQPILLLRDELKTLAATAPGVTLCHGLSDGVPEADVHFPLCSLAHKLDWVPETSWPGPYLHAAENPPKLPGKRAKHRVGLIWAGNPDHINDANRSLALSDLTPLFDRSDVEWFSLQLGQGSIELAASPWSGLIRDISPELVNFAASAAFLNELDLLISVDTAAAHLAGALGKPAWIMLPAIGSDWRWGQNGETNFWYPSLRLLRQTTPGNWSAVMADIDNRLNRLA